MAKQSPVRCLGARLFLSVGGNEGREVVEGRGKLVERDTHWAPVGITGLCGLERKTIARFSLSLLLKKLYMYVCVCIHC